MNYLEVNTIPSRGHCGPIPLALTTKNGLMPNQDSYFFKARSNKERERTGKGSS